MADESLISQLASEDARVRARAAGELFARARATIDTIISAWLLDSELSGLLHAPELRMTAGIAVEPARFEAIRKAHGSPRLADVPPGQDAKEFELHFDGSVRLDILTAKAPGGAGAIARFLEKFGEGIQQIEFEVTDAERSTELLRTRFQLEPVYPATSAGADDTRVNFFLVPLPGGRKALIELVQIVRP